MDEKILSSYHAWCAHASADPDLARELAAMAQDEAALSDAFYRDLAFGTGGLRGVIGAGTNRMNVYTVRQATQGLADYLNLDRSALSKELGKMQKEGILEFHKNKFTLRHPSL